MTLCMPPRPPGYGFAGLYPFRPKRDKLVHKEVRYGNIA
jgi:hypothetical protein